MPISSSADPQPQAELRSAAMTPVAAFWAAAAVLFVIYPALRPYSSETGLAGARSFASDAWLWAHVAGMAGFGLMAAGCGLLPAPAMVKRGAVLGVALILPYYGAETFGLHAVGGSALQYGADGLADTADAIRYNPVAVLTFGLGWLVLAVVGIGLARLWWGWGHRAAAVGIGAGLVLYLPQFFGPPVLRMAHGVILAGGLVLAAAALTRRARG